MAGAPAPTTAAIIAQESQGSRNRLLDRGKPVCDHANCLPANGSGQAHFPVLLGVTPMRAIAIGFLILVPLTLQAADWPHWLGPRSDGSTPETGLLVEWPKTGPKVLWKVEGGEGY